MPTLVTAGLFNFHFSEVFNLSAVGFYSLKTKPQSPYLDFSFIRAEVQILSEQTIILMQNWRHDSLKSGKSVTTWLISRKPLSSEMGV